MRSLQVLPLYQVAPEGPEDSSSLAEAQGYPPNGCLTPGSCRLVGVNAGVPVMCQSVLWSLGHLSRVSTPTEGDAPLLIRNLLSYWSAPF